MGEQGIRNQVAAAAGSLQCPAKIVGVPQHDGGGAQFQAACAMLLVLGGAVVQPAKTVEAHGAGQRVISSAGIALSLPEHAFHSFGLAFGCGERLGHVIMLGGRL